MGRFSNRNGYRELPTQLKLEEISQVVRSRLLLAFDRLLNTYILNGNYGPYLSPEGQKVFEDFWVKELRQTTNWKPSKSKAYELLIAIIKNEEFWQIFDTIEFFAEKSQNIAFRNEVTEAFIEERMAYRFKDGHIIAVGSEEQAENLERAFNKLEKEGAKSASSHLHKASRLLAQGEYGDSVRESVHAVESAARKIEPTAKSLGQALNTINNNNTSRIHPSLNEAFKKMYGYASDEQGIRHPLIDKTIAEVSEADALFMLGACSAFIPYLFANLD